MEMMLALKSFNLLRWVHAPGHELYWDPSLGTFERLYCCLFGVPIIGLRIRCRRLRKLLPDRASHILDAGCGRGVISRLLAMRYSTGVVDAIDTDEDRQLANTLIARQMGLENCRFEVADVATYCRPGYYDLILSVDNLEHIEDDMAVLEKFSVSLKAGGTLLIHVPYYYRRWPVLKIIKNFDVPGHVRPGYHMAELTEQVTSVGLKVIRCGFSYGFLENLANNLSYSLTGAQEKNKLLYAVLFPVLNAIAWLGQWSWPKVGAGLWLIAEKSTTDLMQK